MPQFDWLCDMYRCVMSPTSGIYWVELGFINNYKEPQLWLVLLRYSANVASAFPWVITVAVKELPHRQPSGTVGHGTIQNLHCYEDPPGIEGNLVDG